MKYLSKIYIPLVIIVSFLVQGMVTWGLKDDGNVIMAVEEIQNEYCETIIQVKGDYVKGFLSENDIISLQEYISLNTGVPKEKIEINTAKKNQHIYINLVFEGVSDGACNYMDMLVEVVKECGFNASASFVVKKEKKGELTLSEKQGIYKNILKKLDAKEITQIQDEEGNLFVYGYSKGLKSVVLCENQKINISITFSYDEIKGVTNVYVATPILDIDI